MDLMDIRLKKRVPAYILPEQKKELIKEVFILFDSNKDGKLEYLELKAAVKALGFPIHKAEVLRILKTYDKTHGKLIDFDGFFDVLTEKMKKQDPLVELKQAYNIIANEQVGGIRKQELRKIADIIREDISDEELSAMIEEFDLNNDGKRSRMMSTLWADRHRETLLEGRAALERTSESLIRSERTALEAESVGANIVSELEQQRETLLRASARLSDINQGLSRSHVILQTMTRRVFTNKFILIIIILSEVGILCSLIYIKFIKH